MNNLVNKTIQENTEVLDRLARHDSGEEVIDTSGIARKMIEKITHLGNNKDI